jgi:23S rRNA (guanosine2251-2'-O)-methyltransferase
MAGGKGGGQGGRGNKAGSHRKGAQKGSGGLGRRALAGRGPTPRAEMRKGHPAQRRAQAAARRAQTTQPRRTARKDGPELVTGRNPVIEALRAGIPVNALYVAQFIESDDRVRESLRLATENGIALLEVPRQQLDRMTDGAPHQGIAIQVPPYDYAHPDDLVTLAQDAAALPLIVALDGVTDPRNLGAIVRSAAAFAATGVVVPERRAAGMTASAWKASAGAAVRLPVARAGNLTRALESYKKQGLMVVGLDAAGSVDLGDLEAATEPLVLVIGAEGKGLSRLVAQTCDLTVRVPIAATTESLNASVAASIALYEVARKRR